MIDYLICLECMTNLIRYSLVLITPIGIQTHDRPRAAAAVVTQLRHCNPHHRGYQLHKSRVHCDRLTNSRVTHNPPTQIGTYPPAPKTARMYELFPFNRFLKMFGETSFQETFLA